MEILEDKQYRKNIKKKNSILVCAPSKGYPDQPRNIIGKCYDCNVGVVFGEESKACKIKICPTCGLKRLKKFEKKGIDFIPTAHIKSKEYIDKLDEQFIMKELKRDSIAS